MRVSDDKPDRQRVECGAERIAGAVEPVGGLRIMVETGAAPAINM